MHDKDLERGSEGERPPSETEGTTDRQTTDTWTHWLLSKREATAADDTSERNDDSGAFR